MFTRKLVVGRGRVRQSFVDQIGQLIEISKRQMNGVPTLIGEVGIPSQT